jgi:hypothetical protein
MLRTLHVHYQRVHQLVLKLSIQFVEPYSRICSTRFVLLLDELPDDETMRFKTFRSFTVLIQLWMCKWLILCILFNDYCRLIYCLCCLLKINKLEISILHPINTQYKFYVLRWKLIVTPQSDFLRIFVLIQYFSVVLKFFSQAVLYFNMIL